MAQENAWGPINVIRVHKCSLKLMWCSWRCSDDVKDTHNRKEWAGNLSAPYRTCVPVIRKKHSGVSLVLSSATSDVSFREKGIRPLGCGYKRPGGALSPPPPPRVCVENDQSVVMGFHQILFLNPTCPKRVCPRRVGIVWRVELLRTLALRGSGVEWTCVRGLESEGRGWGRLENSVFGVHRERNPSDLRMVSQSEHSVLLERLQRAPLGKGRGLGVGGGGGVAWRTCNTSQGLKRPWGS